MYYSSKDASLSICADLHCVTQKRAYGNLSVTVNAQRSFRFHIFASTKSKLSYDYSAQYSNILSLDYYRYLNNKKFTVLLNKKINNYIDNISLPPFILIKKIQINGGFCHFKTLNELSCEVLNCNFES